MSKVNVYLSTPSPARSRMSGQAVSPTCTIYITCPQREATGRCWL